MYKEADDNAICGEVLVKRRLVAEMKAECGDDLLTLSNNTTYRSGGYASIYPQFVLLTYLCGRRGPWILLPPFISLSLFPFSSCPLHISFHGCPSLACLAPRPPAICHICHPCRNAAFLDFVVFDLVVISGFQPSKVTIVLLSKKPQNRHDECHSSSIWHVSIQCFPCSDTRYPTKSTHSQ